MKVLRKYYWRVSCKWLEMECVMLWIMLFTTKYDFVSYSLESQTFNLQKRRNDGQNQKIITVKDWILGKEKNVKILYLNRKKILKKIYKKKFWENCVLKKEKVYEEILNLKTRKCDNNFEKIFYLEKTEKSKVRQKILRKGYRVKRPLLARLSSLQTLNAN